LPSIVVSIASLGDFGSVVRGHRDRLEQFPRLASLLRTAATRHGADAIVLAGDFNTPGGMPSLEPLAPLLRDGWRTGDMGWGGTMTADMPLSRIDQCWVSSGVEVVAASVRAGAGSDHRMLVVDLLIGSR
jgi:endonuclease/exonuclease/phosphatase (EEP) superfamily protein YafD